MFHAMTTIVSRAFKDLNAATAAGQVNGWPKQIVMSQNRVHHPTHTHTRILDMIPRYYYYYFYALQQFIATNETISFAMECILSGAPHIQYTHARMTHITHIHTCNIAATLEWWTIENDRSVQ